MSDIQKNNIFSRISVNTSQEIIETLAEGANSRIERIVSTGQSTPEDEWYDQKQCEWVLLLTGSATLRFKDEDQAIDLHQGDYVIIPAHKQHRVESTAKNSETIWLVVFYE